MGSAASNYLYGDVLANALVSGIYRVINDQDFLNKINVFPVADGDTGTNLSLSLGAALAFLNSPQEQHLGTLLAVFADTLLDSARGNSGAIVAQFFQGMSDSAGDVTRFTTVTFSTAVSHGSDYAHAALSDPQDGTILSVIRALAESITTQVAQDQDADLSTVLNDAMPRLESALVNTTQQLDVLRKAGVVDAGAKGFFELFKGMSDFISYGTVVDEPDLTTIHSNAREIAIIGSGENCEYRYCTECVVTGTDIDRRKLREALAALGESLILAGTKRKAKIHIHVNEPSTVFEVSRQYGVVSAEKVDDMHLQQHSSHDTTRQFAVIADSAADIADEDMERLDIHMVPCRIQFGDRAYIDKVSITTEEFFAELASNPHHPTTSQPAPGDFRRQFQFLASHFADVLSINLTAAASGTLEAARSAANRIDATGRVYVIDSLNASLGQGMLAVFAAECALAGISAKQTIAEVKALIPETRSYCLLNNLSYAVRGGRVPKWVKTVADLLHVMPIIHTTADGRIALSGFMLGEHNRVARFARHVARRARAIGQLNIAIGHAVALDDARELENHLRDELPAIARLTLMELGAALGVHAGPGALVIATQPYKAAPDHP